VILLTHNERRVYTGLVATQAKESGELMNITVALPGGITMTLHDEEALRAFDTVYSDPNRPARELAVEKGIERLAQPQRQHSWPGEGILLGKRGAKLAEVGCNHHTTNINDVCLKCGRHVGEKEPESTVVEAAEDFRRKHTPVREFDKVEVPWRHWKVADQLYRRRRPAKAAAIAKALGFDRAHVQTALQYLRAHGLAECHGHRWLASSTLRAHGVMAG
jgi:hypothetical protein